MYKQFGNTGIQALNPDSMFIFIAFALDLKAWLLETQNPGSNTPNLQSNVPCPCQTNPEPQSWIHSQVVVSKSCFQHVTKAEASLWKICVAPKPRTVVTVWGPRRCSSKLNWMYNGVRFGSWSGLGPFGGLWCEALVFVDLRAFP